MVAALLVGWAALIMVSYKSVIVALSKADHL